MPISPYCTSQAKAKIMVIRDIERSEIEFVSKTLGCLPIAHVDHMKPEKLGTADLVEEVEVSGGEGENEGGDRDLVMEVDRRADRRREGVSCQTWYDRE